MTQHGHNGGMAGAMVHPALAKTSLEPMGFTGEQRAMIRDTFANGATEGEFAVLLEVASARRLNPLLRQIHFVKRWDGVKKREVWSTQAAIDGLRAIAQRTGLYGGQDEPEFVEQDGRIVCAKVRVYRKDWTRPSVGVAYWAEYVQVTRDGVPTRFWQQMPHVMIAKCAEALALRKAFPEDMSGLYVPEEMAQANNVVPEWVADEAPPGLRLPPKPGVDGEALFAKLCERVDIAEAVGEVNSVARGAKKAADDGVITQAQLAILKDGIARKRKTLAVPEAPKSDPRRGNEDDDRMGADPATERT